MTTPDESSVHPWNQVPGESDLWFNRFEHYRLLWPHSIVEVYREEWRAERRRTEQGEDRKGPGRINPALERETPKEAPGKWYETAKKWQWVERAAAWDAFQIAEIEQKITAEKARTLLTGYALMYRRVAQLNAQAEQLIAMTKDDQKVWVPDVKAIGSGPEAERVDLVQFNASLFHEIRETFNDIAKELGERVKKAETRVILPKAYLESEDELNDDGVNR